VTASDIASFIDTLHLSAEVKGELKAITPANYTGMDLLNTEIG
jgi:adenylosuccinate lyase